MTPTRVLFVSHSYPRADGDIAGSFVHRLAVSLTARGDIVRVLAPATAGLEPTSMLDGIRVDRYGYAPAAWQTLAYEGNMAQQVNGSWRGKVAFGGLLLGGALAVRRTVAAWRPDVVHAHWWLPGALQSAWSIGRTPLMTTLHGSDVRLAIGVPRAHGAFRAVMRRSQRVTAVSRWLRDEALAMAPGTNIDVEPMPVDITLFTPSTGSKENKLLFVGRLNAQKGAGLLLEALAASGSKCALDVIGEGDDRAALAARAATLGLASRVTFHGALAQSQVVPFYQRARAVVVPSQQEGLGLVAVEAQLCETPVIAFRSGGLTDVVIDGDTGYLVPSGDVRAMSLAIDAVDTNPSNALARGRVGRARMLLEFNPASVAENYHRLYQDALRATP